MSDDLRCPDHPNAEIRLDSRAGDMICTTCGLVIGDRVIDVGTEWRSFNNEKSCKDPSRVGAPENPLLSGSDLSTSIAGGGADYGLRNLQRKNMNASDRQLNQAFTVIKEIADRVHIPSSIVDNAKLVYKNAFDTGNLKGKNLQAVSAAALYIACRKDSVPRTFKEIAAISNANMKDIGKAYKQIIKCSRPNNFKNTVSPLDMVNRFVNNLNLTNNDEKMRLNALACLVVERANKLECCTGRSPVSIVAGCIYFACTKLKIDKTHRDIGEVCGAAESTVRQIERSLLPYSGTLLDDSKF